MRSESPRAAKPPLGHIRRTLVRTGFFVFVAGLVVGPGYFLYCTFFSGTQVGKYAVSGQAPRILVLPSGAKHTFDGYRVFEPVALQLDPQMNPVAFNYVVESGGHGTASFNLYRATLFDAGKRVMLAEFSVSREERDSRSGRHYRRVGVFEVPRAGQYLLAIEELPTPQFGASLEIEVRRNVTLPDMKHVFVAGGAAAAGLLFALALLVSRPEQEPKVAMNPTLAALRKENDIVMAIVLPVFLAMMIATAFFMFRY